MLALCKCLMKLNTRRGLAAYRNTIFLNPPNPLRSSIAGWGGERGREAVKHVTARPPSPPNPPGGFGGEGGGEIRRAAQT
jgi:hypothetical protein